MKEKAPTLAGDPLAAERRRMPWLAVEKEYEFAGRRQLTVQRVYIHQLPQSAPRLARLIEDVYGPAAGTHGQRRHFVRRRESEGIPTPQRA